MKLCKTCSREFDNDVKFCPDCGIALIDDDSDVDQYIGKNINDKYRVEKFLGEGGMGRVYIARQLTLKKEIVIKVLHRHLLRDKSTAERFRREAYSASRLDHPNSIRIIDFGRMEDGSLFIAMELLKGKELSEIIEKEYPLDAKRIARIMKTVCSVLYEAHTNKIIHRDLKPENIMLLNRADEKDIVKVLDFGIAKIQEQGTEEGKKLTMQGMVCGTPEYMSPEQARGIELDAGSDIYSLGIILYEMLTGEVPFNDPNPMTILSNHLHTEPPKPSTKAPNVDPELEKICLKAINKKREMRYNTALEMEHDLKAYLEQGQTTLSTKAPVEPAGGGKTMMFGAAPQSSQSAPASGGGTVLMGATADNEAASSVTQTNKEEPSKPKQEQKPKVAPPVAQEAKPAPVVPSPSPSPTTPPSPTTSETVLESSSSKTGLYIVIAVLIVLIAGGGAFFAMNSSKKEEPDTKIADTVKKGESEKPVEPVEKKAEPKENIKVKKTAKHKKKSPSSKKPKQKKVVKPKTKQKLAVNNNSKIQLASKKGLSTTNNNVKIQQPMSIMERNEKALEYYEKGNKALGSGKFNIAKNMFLKSLQFNKKSAISWKKLGMVYMQTSKKHKASKALSRYLRLSPNAPDKVAVQSMINSLK